MSDKQFHTVSAIITTIILFYSFVNGLMQLNCLANPSSSCPIYKSEYLKVNPNILDEFTLFTSLVISLIAFFSLTQFTKNKAISSLLMVAQIGLIIFQKTFIKTIIPF